MKHSSLFSVFLLNIKNVQYKVAKTARIIYIYIVVLFPMSGKQSLLAQRKTAFEIKTSITEKQPREKGLITLN